MEYVLELTSKQLEVLRFACEILSRAHAIQFDIVFDEVLFKTLMYDKLKDYYGGEYIEVLDKIHQIAHDLKTLMAPELSPNAYYGIGSDKICEDAAIAYDLQQVMRNIQSWTENPPKPGESSALLGRIYDSPMQFGKEPLAKIQVKPESGKNVKRKTSKRVRKG